MGMFAFTFIVLGLVQVHQDEAISAALHQLTTTLSTDSPDQQVLQLWPQLEKDASQVSPEALKEFKDGMAHDGLEKLEKRIITITDRLQKFMKYGESMSNFGYFSDLIPDTERQLKNLCFAYRTMGGKSSHALGLAEAAMSSLKQTEEKLANEIIAGNDLPESEYEASDAAGLRAAIRQKLGSVSPSTKVLKVVLDKDGWSEHIRWTWTTAQKWHRNDYATIEGWAVLASHEPKVSYKFPVTVVKDAREIQIQVVPDMEKPAPRYLINTVKVDN